MTEDTETTTQTVFQLITMSEIAGLFSLLMYLLKQEKKQIIEEIQKTIQNELMKITKTSQYKRKRSRNKDDNNQDDRKYRS